MESIQTVKKSSINAEYFQQFNRPYEVFTNSLSLDLILKQVATCFNYMQQFTGMFKDLLLDKILVPSQGDIYFGLNISSIVYNFLIKYEKKWVKINLLMIYLG